MGSLHERKIEAGARSFLEPGEEVLAAIIAAPRGHTQSVAGSMELGAAQKRRAGGAAEQAGLRLAGPMAVAVTQRRLLTLRIGTPIGLGIGGQVKELLSAVPIAEVDSIQVKRLLLGKTVTLTVRGTPIKLEANAMAGATRLADAYSEVKSRGAIPAAGR